MLTLIQSFPQLILLLKRVKDPESSDDELPEISFDAHPFKKWEEKKKTSSSEVNMYTDSVTDNVVTDHITDHTKSTCEQDTSNKNCTWINSEEQIGGEQFPIAERSLPECDSSDIEIISLCEEVPKEFSMAAENSLPIPNDNTIVDELFNKNIPEPVLWLSILSALESCNTFPQLLKLATELDSRIPKIKPRIAAAYRHGVDKIDQVAQSEIPLDGLMQLMAVATKGDGNCLPRATSKGYFNTDEMHIEIRVRIVIEGVIRMHLCLIPNSLERGASHLHKNADLMTVFAMFSNYYTPGQK